MGKAGHRNLRSYLVVLCGLLMLADLYLIFLVAPTEAVMGNIQRVFYFHLPFAVMSFGAFLIVFVAVSPSWSRDRSGGIGWRRPPRK